MSSGFLLVLILLLPLVLALLTLAPGTKARSLALLPLAPLPGLLGALFLPPGSIFEAPGLLPGIRLSLDDNGRLFLGSAAFLWMAAGILAHAYVRERLNPARFCAFWCLTLAGNLGVFIAGDVITFYTAFTCVSLAAWPLIVESREEDALRAGRVYITLAIFGEACLVSGFMLAAAHAETLAIADIKAAIVVSSFRDSALALLVIGFGIKAGLAPLHVWLPLAHPAAPTPASAVLSGAIVKAGIFGLMQFLPFGTALPEWQYLLVVIGLVTAFFGIVIGLTQHNPKTILAYSTISQMGVLVTVLAMALQSGAPDTALTVASLYALHHGLAKGALFMGVGVIAATSARMLAPMLALLVIPAFSMAGAPMMGGALAKLAIKPVMGSGAAALLVTLSAVGTSLLMMRFLVMVARSPALRPEARPVRGMLLPWMATIAASLIVPWALVGQTTVPSLALQNLWSALWPILAATIIALVAKRANISGPPVPEGDILRPALLFARQVRTSVSLIRNRKIQSPRRLRIAPPEWPGDVEHLLSRLSVSGIVLVMLALAGVF